MRWPEVVAALRCRRTYSPRPGDSNLLERLQLRRVRGGSNALYALSHDGVAYYVKLYTTRGRAGGRSEWNALELLRRHGYASAPSPVYFDASVEPHALVMTRVPGTTLRHRRLTRPILAALAGALAGMYRIGRAEAIDLPVALDHTRLARVLPEWVEQLAAEPSAVRGPLEQEALALAGEWAAGRDPDLLRRSAPLVFSRVDANFLNCLWDGRRVWIVDYEFAGWKDRVIDLADLLEVDAMTAILFRRAHRPRASEQTGRGSSGTSSSPPRSAGDCSPPAAG